MSPTRDWDSWARTFESIDGPDEFAGLFVDIAGPKAQNHIPFLGHASEFPMEMLSSRNIRHGRMSMLTNRIRYRRTGHSGDRLLARGIYIGDVQNISGIKSYAKLVSERLRPRIAMWLKHDHNPLSTHTSRHRQSCLDLRGMMPVIVEYLQVLILQFRLKATPGSAEGGQCR